MLTYDLEKGRFLYDSLYRAIRGDILAGVLKPGERLPSRRTLAAHLKVSVSTVQTAYAQLCAEGYLVTREKRGFFVAGDAASPAAPPAESASVPQETAPLPEVPPVQWKLNLRASSTLPMPFTAWARLTRQVLTEQGPELLSPVPHSGVPELRTAISSYLYRFRGITVSPEQIVIGAGTQYLCNLVVQLLGRDPVYALEDPGYPAAGRVYRLNGASCVLLPLDAQGVSPESAEQSGAQILHLSPAHQYPTGAVMPVPRRQALLRWAESSPDRYIIEDDYDSEFRFSGRPIPPMQSIDTGGRVLYMNTFSRTLSPSMRISCLVLPPTLLERYRSRLGFYSCTVSALEQYTLARFLSTGGFEQHLNRSRLRYRKQRDSILEALAASRIAGRSRVSGEEAGLHFLLTLDTALPDGELRRRAEGEGICLSFLSDFCAEPRPRWDRTLILPYPALDPQALREGMDVLASLLD